MSFFWQRHNTCIQLLYFYGYVLRNVLMYSANVWASAVFVYDAIFSDHYKIFGLANPQQFTDRNNINRQSSFSFMKGTGDFAPFSLFHSRSIYYLLRNTTVVFQFRMERSLISRSWTTFSIFIHTCVRKWLDCALDWPDMCIRSKSKFDYRSMRWRYLLQIHLRHRQRRVQTRVVRFMLLVS